MQLPSVDPRDGRPAHGGRDRHIAITVNNIDLIKERLEVRNLSFTMSMSGRRALFCRDPDGNAYEFVEDVTL
jgi:glyoxylase I family protein